MKSLKLRFFVTYTLADGRAETIRILTPDPREVNPPAGTISFIIFERIQGYEEIDGKTVPTPVVDQNFSTPYFV